MGVQARRKGISDIDDLVGNFGFLNLGMLYFQQPIR
jgi:hypothetical protein